MEDFKPFTCSLSKFVRRKTDGGFEGEEVGEWKGLEMPIPEVGWRGGKGVGGGWDCEMNGFCGFLSGGEERGWHFSGDESFSTGPGAAGVVEVGPGLGVEVDGEKKGAVGAGGSRL